MIDGLQLLQNSMMDYGTAVNEDRAIPDAKTGLKPIHLKILYEMWIDKVRSSGKYQKNAKMVGAIIARFSEHGDTSAYDALVRLGQDWIQNYPLIDFHGNNGSIFGDGPGAFRYTESRLAKIAEDGFLQNLDTALPQKYWGLNFTEEEPEPLTLPALFPGLFCLPNQGIGYGVACNFLSFNLKDVYTIVKEYLTGAEELSTIYYDLPTGGTFVNPKVMKDIYLFGKGSVVIESKYEIEKDKIIITEVPWNIEVDKLLDKLHEMINDESAGVKEVVNESGNSKLRIVITCKSDAKPENVLNYLFSKTDLRKSYGVNQNALKDGKPVIVNIYEMVDIYTKHNLECIQTEFTNEANSLKKRIHIIKGLLVAIKHIEHVVQLMKTQHPKEELKTVYNLDEEQINAIFKMTLSRLSNIETDKLIREKKEKEERFKYCELVLKNAEGEQEEILLERLSDLVNKYAKPRRTIVQEKKITKISTSKKAKAAVPVQLGIDFIPTGGYVKAMPISSYKKDSKAITSFKCMSNEMLLLFSSLGHVFRIKAGEIKTCTAKERGVAIGTLVKLQENETILNVFTMEVDQKHPYISMFTKMGQVKKTEKSVYTGSTRNLTGLKACGIIDNDMIVGVYETNGDYATVYTKEGYHITFAMDEVRTTGKTSHGVKAIALQENDEVIKADVASTPKYKVQKRGGKGIHDKI